ncbi:thioredoxin family protein [Lutibacter sp.]|uniref:thioredoxin family protein n=1 Tax=Lutibacter sp. TaxID=1925666 RepID=UPI003566F812
MKTIKILGTGCPSCISAEKVVANIVKELNIEAKIVKVTDIQEIMIYDVMRTPAIVIDGKVVIAGKIPSKEDLLPFLVDNFANNACCSDGNTDSSCCSSEENESGCC